jgi:hypothetical protein
MCENLAHGGPCYNHQYTKLIDTSTAMNKVERIAQPNQTLTNEEINRREELQLKAHRGGTISKLEQEELNTFNRIESDESELSKKEQEDYAKSAASHAVADETLNIYAARNGATYRADLAYYQKKSIQLAGADLMTRKEEEVTAKCKEDVAALKFQSDNRKTDIRNKLARIKGKSDPGSIAKRKKLHDALRAETESASLAKRKLIDEMESRIENKAYNYNIDESQLAEAVKNIDSDQDYALSHLDKQVAEKIYDDPTYKETIDNTIVVKGGGKARVDGYAKVKEMVRRYEGMKPDYANFEDLRNSKVKVIALSKDERQLTILNNPDATEEEVNSLSGLHAKFKADPEAYQELSSKAAEFDSNKASNPARHEKAAQFHSLKREANKRAADYKRYKDSKKTQPTTATPIVAGQTSLPMGSFGTRVVGSDMNTVTDVRADSRNSENVIPPSSQASKLRSSLPDPSALKPQTTLPSAVRAKPPAPSPTTEPKLSARLDNQATAGTASKSVKPPIQATLPARPVVPPITPPAPPRHSSATPDSREDAGMDALRSKLGGKAPSKASGLVSNEFPEPTFADPAPFKSAFPAPASLKPEEFPERRQPKGIIDAELSEMNQDREEKKARIFGWKN